MSCVQQRPHALLHRSVSDSAGSQVESGAVSAVEWEQRMLPKLEA
jgi:hypothetical protein